MNSFSTLRNLQIIVLLVFIFHLDSYGSDYQYDYGPEMAGYQFNRFERLKSLSSSPRFINYEVKAKKESDLLEDLLNPNLSVKDADRRVPVPADASSIRARSNAACPDSKCFQCLDSCRHLKKSKVATNSLIQYTYLRLCSMGCKEELDCLANNYCLPVMAENPDYFVQCSSKCNLFLIVPKIFQTSTKC